MENFILLNVADFRGAYSGNYIFLEINPNGQWAWLETQTGLGISEAIIKELTNE